MSAPGSLRLGIAGCGRIAELGYVPAALAVPGVHLAALADPDAGRLGRCRALCEAGDGGALATFPDAGSLLESAPVDALVIAAPAALHEPLAALAASAGVPSLVEKPPAPDLEGALQLTALQPAPLVAFNRRFLQGAELAASIPADGWLEMEMELAYRRDAWGAHEARDDALLDAGVHLIDLAAFLSGAAPISVRGAAIEPERASFELELGRGRAQIRCATDRRHRERVEIRNRAGRRLGESRLGGVRGRFAALRGTPHPLVVSLRRQLAALRSALRDGADAGLGTAQDGVAAMAVVEAVRRSAELGGAEVTVAIPTASHRPASRGVGGPSADQPWEART